LSGSGPGSSAASGDSTSPTKRSTDCWGGQESWVSTWWTPPSATATTWPKRSSARPLDAKEVIGQLEASLRALGTDHVDLYQAHSGPDEVIDHGGLWEALRQQVAKGTVRHLGLSLSGDDLDQARRARQLGAVMVQVGYNRLDRTGEGGLLPGLPGQDLGVMAREPLANGYLSGKYRPGGASPLVATGAPAATGPRSSASSRWWRRSDGPRCPRGWPWPSGPSPGACSTRPSAVSWPAPDRSNRWSPTPTRPT
jgi:aryl-alcohol dehydrogenase-like predicted oxidoreductase